MFETINGWTKERMKEQIRLKNNGTKALIKSEESEKCVYRTEDGNACAVGCFIPDEDYRPEMDRRTMLPTCLEKEFPELMKKLPLEPLALEQMQSIHDRGSKVGDVRIRLCDWIDKNVIDSTTTEGNTNVRTTETT